MKDFCAVLVLTVVLLLGVCYLGHVPPAAVGGLVGDIVTRVLTLGLDVIEGVR